MPALRLASLAQGKYLGESKGIELAQLVKSMPSWLKIKFNIWISEKIARAYQEIHAERLRKMSQGIPRELAGVNSILATLNNNSWAVHHLFKRARTDEQHANAFLYFFYSFELTLKHLIISEMNLQNTTTMLLNIESKLGFFSKYGEKKMLEILEGEFTVGALIKEFLNIFPNFVHKDNLWKINNERKYIIHNMLKREVSETDIERSFQAFFHSVDHEIKNVLKEFDDIFAERPQNLLGKLNSMTESGRPSHKADPK